MKLFVGVFYTLQGGVNLTFALLLYISYPWFVLVVGFLPFYTSILSLLAAILSLLAAREFFRKNEETARELGIASSVLFILFYGLMFYGLMAVNIWINSSNGIIRHYRGFHTIFLFLSVIIVELNVISIFHLYENKKNRSI